MTYRRYAGTIDYRSLDAAQKAVVAHVRDCAEEDAVTLAYLAIACRERFAHAERSLLLQLTRELLNVLCVRELVRLEWVWQEGGRWHDRALTSTEEDGVYEDDALWADDWTADRSEPRVCVVFVDTPENQR